MILSRYQAWLQGGDPVDLNDAMAELLPMLHDQARRVLGNAADADDAVQEACVVLLRTRARLPAGPPLAAIANRLTRQRALMEARSRQRRWRRFAGGPMLRHL